ncbi:YoaK family protein [Parvimonas sp. KA00067]|uniref:YoaK family protein n=1 Tax=Parvimonas sp. KA00067 TaxID=1588755 RepID=UPI0008396280|nr:YoaK family protein [Parvimonas sp. KA00067]
MKKALQMSESIEVAIFLALSGGLMDAYSYLLRGEVFANAQTGNMLLFGVYASKGNLEKCLKYAFPIAFFAFGIFLADLFRKKDSFKLHWRQNAVIFEIILLFIVGFIPQNMNALANALTSFACGIQVQSFKKLCGIDFSTTMCIGNLRGATHNLSEYFYTKNKKFLEHSLMYFTVIFCFVVGAIIGSKFSESLGLKTILLSTISLTICTIIMFIDREKEKR